MTGENEVKKAPLLANIGGPALFSDVGKQAKDLVLKGFVGGHTLMLSCVGPRAATITTTATIVQDITVGIVQANFQEGNTTHNLSFATTGNQVKCRIFSLGRVALVRCCDSMETPGVGYVCAIALVGFILG